MPHPLPDISRNPSIGGYTLDEVIHAHADRVRGGATETATGVGGALDYLLYHSVSGQVLNVMYQCFGVLVLPLLWIIPPHWKRRAAQADSAARIER